MSNLIQFEGSGLASLEDSKADQIKAVFKPMVTMLEGFESDYNALVLESEKGIDEELTKKAKRLRLDIRKVRTSAESARKQQKEQYLRAGKAIDGVSNILKWAVQEKEENLEKIEKHFEIQEQQRLEKLQSDRAEKLSAYVEDAHERDLSKFADDEFEALLLMKKQQQEERIAAEKKAEEERIAKEKAEKEEQERIKKENEKLRKEAEEARRLAKIEEDKRRKEQEALQAKQEAERKQREAKERKEKEAYEAKLKAEREAREKLEREEKAKREKLEAELKAKEEAEKQAKLKAEAERQAELNKGDTEKVKDLIDSLNEIKGKYSFESDKNKKMYKDVGLLIDKIVNHIQG